MTTRVLLVEDEPSLAKAVARFLGRSGYVVVVAGSCEEAQGAAGPFRAGVLDIELPDGNGAKLASQLIARAVVQSVVFFTATRDHRLREAATRLGPICEKSGGVRELVALLQQTTERSQKMVAGGPPIASTVPPASGVRANDRED